MDLKDLKLIASYRIYDSNNTKSDKKKMLEFVQTASESQIKHLILYGRISSESVAEKYNVSDEKFTEVLSEALPQQRSLLSIAGFVPGNIIGKLTGIPMLGPALWAAFRAVKSKFELCEKKCGTFEFNTVRRQYCIAQCKISHYPQILAKLKQSKSKCPDEKCKAKIDRAIADVQRKFEKAKTDFKELQADFKRRGAETPSEAYKQADELINQVISEAGGRVEKLRKTWMSHTAAAAGVTTPIWALYRHIRSQHDECTNRCGKFELNSSRRQHCMAKCRVDKIQKQLEAAKKVKDQEEIAKKQKALAKAKAAYEKSKESFKSRGVNL